MNNAIVRRDDRFTYTKEQFKGALKPLEKLSTDRYVAHREVYA